MPSDQPWPPTRRTVLRAGAAVALGASLPLLGACRRKAPQVGASTPGARTITVYTSADAELAELTFNAFTEQSGIAVAPVTDTEATKTTGLVNRLIGEKAAPRADVWWSSEPFGTIRLAREGVLKRWRAPIAEAAMASSPSGRWPADLRESADDATIEAPLWYAFGSRLRVMVYDTGRVSPADLSPKAGTLGLLLDPKYKGRVAIARPEFGTTRGHMALLHALHGDDKLRAFLTALKANDVQVLDGNATVVRAVGTGRALLGLTDSDDIFAGQRQKWPVDMMLEPHRPDEIASVAGSLPPTGPFSLPNTVALVAGTAKETDAQAFIEFLLSPAAQRLMAVSDSRNIPVDPDLRRELASWAPDTRPPDRRLEAIEASIEPAMKAVREVLGA